MEFDSRHCSHGMRFPFATVALTLALISCAESDDATVSGDLDASDARADIRVADSVVDSPVADRSFDDATGGGDGSAGTGGAAGTGGEAGAGGFAGKGGSSGTGGTAGAGGTGGGAGFGGMGGNAGSGGTAGSGGGAPKPLPTGEIEIGLWCGVPPSELKAARFAEIAEANFTSVNNACMGEAYEASYNKKMLELAHGAGLKAHVFDNRISQAFGKDDLTARLQPVVADYSKSPGLLSYHVLDEPAAGVFGSVAALRAEIEKLDPAHYGSINLLPNYASKEMLQTSTYDEYVSTFLSIVKPKSFTYDHYNFLADGTDYVGFFWNLVDVRRNSVKTGIPFGQYIQSISYINHRATNGPEKLWAGLSTLAYGGRSVLYFTYWTPPQSFENFGDGIISASGQRTSQYNEVKANNAILRAIGRYLSKAVSTKVFHNVSLPLGTETRAPGDIVYIPSDKDVFVGLFKVNSDAYALVVNGTHKADVQTDVVFASSTNKVNVLNVATGKFEPVSGKADPYGLRVNVSLGRGDGRLYHIVSPAAKGAPGAEGYLGVVRADQGMLHVVDSSFGTAPLQLAGWDVCPTGTTSIGKLFDHNGFWLCVRSDLSNRKFYVGNVVGDAGYLYSLEKGNVTHLGPRGWSDPCLSGSKFLGRRFESNGFWVCME